MNKNLGIILAIIVVLGGAYLLMSGGKKDAMVTNETVMQEKSDQMMMQDKPATTSDMMKKEETSMTGKDTMMEKSGTYEAYAPEKVALASADHDVVLFFRASWCPTCRALDSDIKNNLSKIPKSVTILDVNYDNSTALKQKYGVTYQHTLVQVDKDGNMIKKWSGSPTLSVLVSEIK